MKFHSQTFLFTIIIIFSNMPTTYAYDIDLQGGKLIINGSDLSGGNPPALGWSGLGRIDMGWGGNGGGNLEAYSNGHVGRAGEFKFIYGGAPGLGRIAFTHYTGSTWEDRMVITSNGQVGLGTSDFQTCSDCKLQVNGKVRAKEILVDNDYWPDYVFKENYNLMPLSDLNEFIKYHGHLPKVPSADSIKLDGLDVSKMTSILLEKVEEITLHVIQLEKQNRQLSDELAYIKNLSNLD